MPTLSWFQLLNERTSFFGSPFHAKVSFLSSSSPKVLSVADVWLSVCTTDYHSFFLLLLQSVSSSRVVLCSRASHSAFAPSGPMLLSVYKGIIAYGVMPWKKLLFIQCKPFKLRHLRVVFVWRARLSAFTPWSPMLLPVMFHPGQCYD